MSYSSEARGGAVKYCFKKDPTREQVSEGQLKQCSCDVLVSAISLDKLYTSEMV